MLEIGQRGMAITHGSDAIVSNTELAVKLRLHVEPTGEPAFEVETRMRFPQLALPHVGQRIGVIYDPEDHESIMRDESQEAMLSASGLRPDQIAAIEASQEIAAAGGSPAEILARVNEIRAAAGVGPAQVLGGPAAPEDPVDQLTKLAALLEKGLITDAEFAAQKARILGSPGA